MFDLFNKMLETGKEAEKGKDSALPAAFRSISIPWATGIPCENAGPKLFLPARSMKTCRGVVCGQGGRGKLFGIAHAPDAGQRQRRRQRD